MNKNLKKYAVLCTILTIIVVLAQFGCAMVDNTVPENRIWSILFNMIGFGISPFVFLVEGRAYTIKESWESKIVYVPVCINLILVITSGLTGWIFYVDEDCKYTRGICFVAYIVVFAFSVIMSMLQKIKIIRNYPKYFKTRIISSTIVMLMALIIQVALPEYLISWLIISVYLLLYYALSCEMQSMVDGLTKLLNRSVFNAMITNLDLSLNKNYYLVMLDLNNFKQVNDAKGHAYGDIILNDIAVMLTEIFKKDANVFRFGGDEFAVLTICNEEAEIIAKLGNIESYVAEKRILEPYYPGIAAGYEKFVPGTEFREIINSADFKMYKNKHEMKK